MVIREGRCSGWCTRRRGRPLGYAKYRTGDDMLEVQELMGLTPAAWAALWGYCLGMDLTTGATASRRPVDDPLLWMLADPARLRRSVMDRMWLRVVDVGPALERRRYNVEGRLVLQVTGRLLPVERGCVRAGGRRELRVVPADGLGAGPGAVGGRPGRGVPWGRRVHDAGARRARGRADAWARCQWRTRCFVRGWRRGRLIICEGGGRWKETAPV